MKRTVLSLFIATISIQNAIAQDSPLNQSFLFDEEDIIIRAKTEENNEAPVQKTDEDINNAITQAKNLLNQKPTKLPSINLPKGKNSQNNNESFAKMYQNLKEAPFGLFWGASQKATLNQGVVLRQAPLKDYENSFLASSLPKPLSFFDQTYVVFGKDDELYRILTYSKEISDTGSAQKTIDEYNKYSKLLEKKYGNKQTFFTPYTIEKTIKNAQNKSEIVKETAPIGNPDFLNQLASGQAVLYSTYHNNDIAAALSISVDGEKKSYIVIDYKNLKIIQKQENITLDAL